MTGSILTAAERALLVERGVELLELEERYGSQQAALAARPDLAGTARALQRARAQAAARALGLKLRGDGRPLPADVLAELDLVFARIVASEDNADPLGEVTAAARLARLLDDDLVDDDPQ